MVSVQAQIETEMRHWVKCPACDGRVGTIDHLLSDTKPVKAGPWSCDDCGKAWFITMHSEQNIQLKHAPDHDKTNTLVLLKLDKTYADEIFFVVEGLRFETDNPYTNDKNRYFYEEHSCPVNHIRCPVLTRDATGDINVDPHGVLRFVAAVDHPGKDVWDNLGPDDDAEYVMLFPQLSATKERE